MTKKKIAIKSKTAQMRAERNVPSFSYTWNTTADVVEVDAEHAKHILSNPMFYEVNGTIPKTTKKKEPDKPKKSSFEAPPKEEDE